MRSVTLSFDDEVFSLFELLAAKEDLRPETALAGWLNDLAAEYLEKRPRASDLVAEGRGNGFATPKSKKGYRPPRLVPAS